MEMANHGDHADNKRLVTFWVDDAERDALKAAALAEGKTVTDFLRDLYHEHIREKQNNGNGNNSRP